jgi:hypothetical protein
VSRKSLLQTGFTFPNRRGKLIRPTRGGAVW